MRVRRSLTIKQMAAVSSVALVTICVFIVIQLFHFVEQRRDDYAQQLENIAHSVARPLSQSVLNADLDETQHILNTLRPVGILNRADVVLPNQIQTLSTHYPEGRSVPSWITKGFDLPIKVSVPLYSPAANPTNAQPLAYLVLQADPYRMYQFIVSALSTMLTTYLLLALILSIAISWCINRLIIHPLRSIARELQALPESEVHYHQLAARPRHEDDELGVLIRSYNRNQLLLDKALKAMQSTSQLSSRQQDNSQTLTFDSRQENDVLRAINQNDFSLLLRPQINLLTGELSGAEAFLCREFAGGEGVQENDVIVTGKELAAVASLSEKLLELSCRTLADWMRRDIKLPLAITLSGVQVQRFPLLQSLKTLLRRYQIGQGYLMLQITETALINDWGSMVSTLGELRALGVSIRLVADGVEAEPQRDWLLSQGIIFVQGELFSAPLPISEFEVKFIST
ncbi:hypothetical protein BS639_16320 [Rouxiella silvae]|uniref:EAL domain-containing protein n=2 Tax=Rouxiella silvae TaxID=1646373 RepID=A0ABX3TYN6_9GAMM|nr:EAL domain-containing protein [Rouxiella silvae]ORJ20173.1 hypothetical protein BS639_16320 [Rouxiella silvae]